MRRCLGFALVIFSGVSDGSTISMSLRALPVLDQTQAVDATHELEALVQEHQSSITNNDIEGVEVILGAFAQMIGSFAMVMANLESPTIAAASISSIVTNAFKVVIELAKHKSNLIHTGEYDSYYARGNNAQYTLEAMEHELLAQQARPDQDIDPKAKVILANFAGMIGNCANIVGDPHNPKVIGSNVAGLLARILDIAVQAANRGVLTSTTTPQELEEYFLADEETLNEMTALIKHQAARTRLLRLSAGYENAVS